MGNSEFQLSRSLDITTTRTTFVVMVWPCRTDCPWEPVVAKTQVLVTGTWVRLWDCPETKADVGGTGSWTLTRKLAEYPKHKGMDLLTSGAWVSPLSQLLEDGQ